ESLRQLQRQSPVRGPVALQRPRDVLYLSPNAQQVFAEYFPDVFFAIAAPQQAFDEVRVARDILEADRKAVADTIVIGTDADVIDTGEFDHVVEVIERLLQRRVGIGSMLGFVLLAEPAASLLVLRIQFVRLEVLHESDSSGGAVVEGFLAQEVGAEVDHHESAILRKTHDHVVSHITLPAGSEVTS